MPAGNPSARRAEYEAYLASPKWQQLRTAALERDGQACRICNATRRLDVHHRTYKHFGDEPLGDLVVLCRECHELFHSGRRIADRSKQVKRRIPKHLRRADVRQVACPKCDAASGSFCVNGNGVSRKRCHQQRWDKAADGLRTPTT